MKKITNVGKLTLIISLMISVASAYCTVSGFGKVFASAVITTMAIATVIEIGRIMLVYILHHYWYDLPMIKKIPGVIMLCIAILLSSMGIFGFLANAHSQRTQELLPIELEINQNKSEIKIIEKSIQANNNQIEQIENSLSSEQAEEAIDRYLSMNYITVAMNLKKEQLNSTKPLYNENIEFQKQINELSKNILNLQKQAEITAPTLAHLKYYAQLFGVPNDTAIIIFIVLIMMVFDTLAIYLMVASDWILVFENKKSKTIPHQQETTDVLNSHVYELNQMLNDLKNNNENVSNILIKNEELERELKNIKNYKKFSEKSFQDKLNLVEEQLRNLGKTAKEKKDENNIDTKVDNLLSLIQDDKNIIYNSNFQQHLIDNKYIGKRLLNKVDSSLKDDLSEIFNKSEV